MSSTKIKEHEAQDLKDTKKQHGKSNNHKPAVDTKATDTVKNTAQESEGLNQARNSGKELEPGTH